jgi:hypothetical protein
MSEYKAIVPATQSRDVAAESTASESTVHPQSSSNASGSGGNGGASGGGGSGGAGAGGSEEKSEAPRRRRKVQGKVAQVACLECRRTRSKVL